MRGLTKAYQMVATRATYSEASLGSTTATKKASTKESC
jgi:hypothetical protein